MHDAIGTFPDDPDNPEDEGDNSSFEILQEDASMTFYLFSRTSREKEEWFNRFLVGAKFMQDWNHQNPPVGKEHTRKQDPKYETYKVREQKFRMFMENYFQVRRNTSLFLARRYSFLTPHLISRIGYFSFRT